MPKFSRRAEERKQHIEPVPSGTIQQLHDVTRLVASKDVSIKFTLKVSSAACLI
jgi:hypothetical protein